jgi:hypothetical protein
LIVSVYLVLLLIFIGFSSQFASEESQHEPLILFLKDVEKMCGNNYTYHGLKNKLESFPAGIFIIGSQTQTDARKDKSNSGSPWLKFPYSQAAILDLAFQVWSTVDFTCIAN